VVLGCADVGDGSTLVAASTNAGTVEPVGEVRVALDDALEPALGDSSDADAMDATATPPVLSRSDSFPDALDYRNLEGRSYVTPPKDQGSCGGCWAFTSAGVFESKLLLTLGTSLDLSEQQQISLNTNMNGCGGGSYSALSFWSTAGSSPLDEACTGYAASTTPLVPLAGCATRPVRLLRGDARPYTVSVADARAVQKSLLDDGPAYFRFDVYPEFYAFWRRSAVEGEAPVYTQPASPSPKRGGHAVLLIGWDDARDAWLLKNSWGDSGGPNGDGTFWMARSGHGKSLGFGMANTRRPEISVGVEESFLRNSGLRAGAGSPALPTAWTPVDGWPAGKWLDRYDGRAGVIDLSSATNGGVNLGHTGIEGVTVAEGTSVSVSFKIVSARLAGDGWYGGASGIGEAPIALELRFLEGGARRVVRKLYHYNHDADSAQNPKFEVVPRGQWVTRTVDLSPSAIGLSRGAQLTDVVVFSSGWARESYVDAVRGIRIASYSSGIANAGLLKTPTAQARDYVSGWSEEPGFDIPPVYVAMRGMRPGVLDLSQDSEASSGRGMSQRFAVPLPVTSSQQLSVTFQVVSASLPGDGYYGGLSGNGEAPVWLKAVFENALGEQRVFRRFYNVTHDGDSAQNPNFELVPASTAETAWQTRSYPIGAMVPPGYNLRSVSLGSSGWRKRSYLESVSVR
jgi:hypothetical protein